MVEESGRSKYKVWEVEVLLRLRQVRPILRQVRLILRQVRDIAQIQSPRQIAFTFPILAHGR
jgi:hypothetical protein